MTHKGFFTAVLIGFLVLCLTLSGQDEASKVVDFEADVMRPINIGDSSVLSLVGHVVFYHNGTVITCDSAIRYSDRMMDCFKNVIINKDSTYIYGDRADYNGNTNTANVYAPLVKMVDKDAVLYSYNFSFNTLTNIGRYTGGGTMLQKDNLLESTDGYYYSDTRDLVGVREVEMHSEEYEIKSDSIVYNLDSEIASFYTRTYIWNDQDQFLTAKKGAYDRKAERYTFTDDSYILTENQELWADTIVYNQGAEDALLFRNIQIIDDEQKAMAFGDFAQYWGKEKKALITRQPSVLSFDDGQDTLYMRSDSIFVYTVNRFDTPADSLSGADSTTVSPGKGLPVPSVTTTGQVKPDVPTGNGLPDDETPADSLSDGATNALDSLKTSSAAPEPSKRELKKKLADERFKAKVQERKEKEELRKLKEAEKRAARGKAEPDTLVADSVDKPVALPVPDPTKQAVKTVLADSTAGASTAAEPTDSMVRIVRAYFNVKIYRSDFQAVCDSLVGFSVDSTVHLYIDPVMWNENNQVKSETIDVYTKNQQVDKAIFRGAPMMSSEVDTAHYNQVAGKVIEAYFRDGAIYKTDVMGNGQTYYYMEEGDSTDRYITGFLDVECADITFYFKDQQIDQIVYKVDPVYSISPMDKIPETKSQFLKGFAWEINRKPTKEQVFDRSIRESMRMQYNEMGRPNYPITDKIKQAKETLIKEGRWFDRNDKVNNDALEFINSLGY